MSESPRRRGRPPGLVSPVAPAGSLAFDADLRAGWMLRAWRLHLAPESNARSFASTLNGLGRSADASRVSRWETGRLPVPFDVIAAYEEALALPHGSLVALAMVTRTLAHPRGDLSQVLDPRHVNVSRFQAALDVAVDGEPEGGDWLDIASFVATHPHQTILPSSVWRNLVRRLLDQLPLSVCAAYATRSQAALLLSLHELARRSLVAVIGEQVTGTRSIVVADAISLLQQIEDPRAGDLVIRLLEHPDAATRDGAIFATSAKLSRGHFDAGQLESLERTLVGLSRRHGLGIGGPFARIADVLEVLPPEIADRVRRAAPHVAVRRPSGPAPLSPHQRSLVAQLARAVARPEGQPEEPMLERLVEEALDHKVAERRFQAGLCIALSPYRARVARGAAALLRGRAEGDPVLEERTMVLLTLVATAAEREQIHALAEDSSSPVRAGALITLAHIPPSDVPVCVELSALTSPGQASQRDVRASLYYAGMTHDPVLKTVQDDLRHPEWVRIAAEWWWREGPAIHEHPPVL